MPADSPSTDVATQDDRTPAEKLLETVRHPRFQEQVALALPENMPPARFVRVAVTALMENPELANAEPFSVRNSLMKAAADGLLPDGREAALVLFTNRETGAKTASYLPMVGGFRKIAADHGWSLRAAVVYDGDDFDYELGPDPKIQHRAAPLGVKREKIVAAYAYARRFRDGAVEVLVMTAAEVEKVRRTAKRKEIWNEWPERMYEKTAARRLFKTLPLGDRELVARVLDADELEPGAAAELAYGQDRPGEGVVPAEDAAAHDPDGGAQEPAEAAPPAPFTGEEPEDEVDLEAEHDRGVVIGFGKHEGETLGDLADAGNRSYLRWLGSDAVEDEELREAAGRVLASLR